MSLLVKTSENRELTVQGQSIGRIRVVVFLSHGSVNTDITPDQLDMTKAFLKLKLSRNGIIHNIYDDSLLPVALMSQMDGNLDYIHPLNTTAVKMAIVLAKGAAVKEQAIMAFNIDLPGVINVKDNDKLSMSLQLNSGVFAAALDQSISYIALTPEPVVGYETAIPEIKVHIINQGESQVSPPIGDDVVAIHYLNIDKDGILEADAPINQVSLSSDKFNYTATERELMSVRFADITNPDIARTHRHSHVIYKGPEIDGVKLDVNFTSANVAAAKNWIVVSKCNADLYTADRAMKLQQKHQEKNVSKVLNSAKSDAKHIVERIRGRR